MENLTIPCPQCGYELHLPGRSLLGKDARCPECNHKFILEESGQRTSDGSAQESGETDVPSTLKDAGVETPAPGKSIRKEFGRYRILRQLGQGAMGAVYLAQDSKLDRPVALKIPKFSDQNDPELLARFIREARSAATLSHAHICPVYDVGEVDGVHYFTMAYIEGYALSNYINREARPPERQVALLIRKLALALEHAHESGVVHRDLKPSNIMIDKRNDPVVMDFGLARQIEAGADRLTQTGMILGTPAYMSPEQVRAEWDKVGPQSDIYSLGVILYEMLTGDVPFSGSVGTVIGQILTRAPVPPRHLCPEIDRDLDSICLSMMAKDAEHRFRSMADVARAIQAYLHGTTPKLPAAAIAEPASDESTNQEVPRQVSASRDESTVATAKSQTVKRPTAKAIAKSSADESLSRRTWYRGKPLQIAAAAVVVGLLAVAIGVGLNREPTPATPAESNPRMTFAEVPAQTADVGQELNFGVQLNDLPTTVAAGELEYRLGPQAPPGCTIDRATGAIRWTPAAGQPAGDYQFLVRVHRSGTGDVLGETQVAVSLTQTNQPPVIGAIADQTVNEEATLKFSVTATDADSATDQLKYRLGPGAPDGVVLHPQTGLFSWRPSEADGPGRYIIAVHVADNGKPPVESMRQFTVDVKEVNKPPLFLPVEDLTSEEGATTTVDLKAIDPDIPISELRFELGTDAPPGCQIDAETGRFTWTLPTGTGGKSYRVPIKVSDDNNNSLTAETAFTISVAAPERVAVFSCFETPDEEQKFVNAIAQLIEVGWPQRRSNSTTSGDFKRAEKMCNRDPRLYYAAGLLDLKQLNYTEASQKIDRAAKRCAYPHLPAWKTMIRRQLAKKDYAKAMLELVALGEAVEAGSPYISKSMRNDCAKWIGQVIGFLEGPSGLKRMESVISTQDEKLSQILTNERQRSYRDGKTSSADLFASLSGVRSRQMDEARQVREQKKEDIVSKESKIRDEQAKLRESVGKTKAQAETILAGYDKQLGRLEADYNRLTTQLQLISASISSLQTQLSNYNTEYQRALQNKNDNLARNYKRLADQAGQSLAAAQQQYVAVDSQRGFVNRQAATLLRNRQLIVAEYQKETGKLLQQNQTLNKWAQRLDSQQESLDNPRKQRTGRIAATDRKLRSIETYVSFDLEAEKLKLLASLRLPPEE